MSNIAFYLKSEHTVKKYLDYFKQAFLLIAVYEQTEPLRCFLRVRMNASNSNNFCKFVSFEQFASIMDIDLLSKMVYDLILENDRVALPGVGCFVAEIVPATFSDKGYTINPPYRKLYFRSHPDDGSLLVDLYAKSNGVSPEASRGIITDFLSEMKEILLAKKVIVFPGLGRLRATKENNLFFVADETLDIYPEGVGLEPLSLKTHRETSEDLTAAMTELGGIISAPAEAPSETPAETPAEALTETPSEEPVEAETPAETPAQAPAEPVVEPQPEPTPEPELTPEPVPTPEPELTPEPVPTPEPQPEPVVEPQPEPTPEPEPTPAPQQPAGSGSRAVTVALIVILSLICLVLIALIAFVLISRTAPELLDPLLYSADELRILNTKI